MVRPVCAALSNWVFSRVGIPLALVQNGHTILGAAPESVKLARRARNYAFQER